MPTLLITGLILMVLCICFVVFYIKKTGKDGIFQSDCTQYFSQKYQQSQIYHHQAVRH
jgi:hypothetical protein